MLNIEKYKNLILEYSLHFAKKKGKLCGCNDITCTNCDFSKEEGGMCKKNKLDWLCSEYIEKPTLTEREWHYCMAVQTGWIAKNKDGETFLYFDKPLKREWTPRGYYNCNAVPKMIAFDFIRWDDEDPWAVEELLKLEVRKDEEE